MTTQLDERRRRLIEQHRLSDDDIQQIIAYNRALLKIFAAARRRATPLSMSRSTFRDRFAVFFKGLIYASRTRTR
jgi:hypothetical protein